MKKSESLVKALEVIQALNQEERDAIINEIMEKMGSKATPVGERPTSARCASIVAKAHPHRPDCPHCAAKAALGYIVKDGDHKGAQRYRCKACGKKFVDTTNTVFARTRKDADTWHKFIEMTLSQKSIAACAEECNICIQTAFNWRHKILNVFAENQKATKMTGSVEADEMLIPISYKGNHIQNGFYYRKKEAGSINDMPRMSYQRGTDNISRSAKEKACVFCMVENGNKAFYAAVPGVGFMSEDMLKATVGKHVEKETATMLADEYKATKKFFEDNGYNHLILKSNTSDNPHDHKPEVKDGLHIQHVNAMHHHIRTFLKPYCGVSSKYLEHYMAMFVWLKSIQATKQRRSLEKVSVARASTPDCYITGRQLRSRPAVPACA